ncbi:hypothetical protein LCL97_02895 [Seohaeicola saemankumensis]|nr:hypothetical protein [Seohaeicola saemankumensis]MCA0869762.1 hypothetical protein [Seohaeicola saemankumensis]
MTEPAQDWKIAADHPAAGLVTEAYRAFAGPPPETLAVCTCCGLSEAAQRNMRIKPAQAITRAEIEDWFASAADATYLADAARHLLPRLIEALAAGACHPTAPELFLERSRAAEHALWTPAQRQVLDRFQRWYLARADWPDGVQLNSVLCLFVLAGWPLDELEAQVLTLPDADIVARLWQGKDRLRDHPAFWPKGMRPPSYLDTQALRDRLYAVILSETLPETVIQQALELDERLDAPGPR